MNNRIQIVAKHNVTVPQAPYRPPQTWENIFNSNHLDIPRLQEVVRLARDSGYPYYLWNLAVWATPATGTASDRVCLQEEIQKG